MYEISLKDILVRIPLLGVMTWMIAMMGPESWRMYGAQAVACFLFPMWVGCIILYVVERSLLLSVLVVTLAIISFVI